VKLRLEKCNQTKSDNSKNLLGQNMEWYKSIFGFNLSNEWVRHNNIGYRNWNDSWNWHLMTHLWSFWNFINREIIISHTGFGMHLVLYACNIWFILSFNLIILVYLNNLILISIYVTTNGTFVDWVERTQSIIS